MFAIYIKIYLKRQLVSCLLFCSYHNNFPTSKFFFFFYLLWNYRPIRIYLLISQLAEYPAAVFVGRDPVVSQPGSDQAVEAQHVQD